MHNTVRGQLSATWTKANVECYPLLRHITATVEVTQKQAGRLQQVSLTFYE